MRVGASIGQYPAVALIQVSGGYIVEMRVGLHDDRASVFTSLDSALERGRRYLVEMMDCEKFNELGDVDDDEEEE